MIDLEYEEYIIQNKELEDRLDTVRKLISSLYDSEYKTLKEMYGGSNDEVGEDDDGVIPPYQAASRSPRPYLQPTAQDESGFTGLEPPVG